MDIEKYKIVGNGVIKTNAGFAKDGDIHLLFGQINYQIQDFYINKKNIISLKNGKKI